MTWSLPRNFRLIGKFNVIGRAAAHHAMENRTSPHRELKRELAGEVIDKLDGSLREGRFDRIALFAPPTVLGDLRDALSESLRAKLVAELAKDLTKVPFQELSHRLEAIWGSKANR
jgi:protein required for attachment to host cells